MSEFIDKAKGLANEAVGKVKQGIGDITGSEKIKAEGVAQEAEGHTQKAIGDAKGTVKDAAGAVSDAIKR